MSAVSTGVLPVFADRVAARLEFDADGELGLGVSLALRRLGAFRTGGLLVVGDPCLIGPDIDGARAETLRTWDPTSRQRFFLPARAGRWEAYAVAVAHAFGAGPATDLIAVHEGAGKALKSRKRLELGWLPVESGTFAILDAERRDADLLADPSEASSRCRLVTGGCVAPTFDGDGAYPVIAAVEKGKAVGVHVRFRPLPGLDDEEDDADGDGGDAGSA